MRGDRAIEIVETQDNIISMQADIIYSLYRLLAQYVTAEELDGLPETEQINQAARLRDGMKQWEG